MNKNIVQKRRILWYREDCTNVYLFLFYWGGVLKFVMLGEGNTEVWGARGHTAVCAGRGGREGEVICIIFIFLHLNFHKNYRQHLSLHSLWIPLNYDMFSIVFSDKVGRQCLSVCEDSRWSQRWGITWICHIIRKGRSCSCICRPLNYNLSPICVHLPNLCPSP